MNIQNTNTYLGSNSKSISSPKFNTSRIEASVSMRINTTLDMSNTSTNGRNKMSKRVRTSARTRRGNKYTNVINISRRCTGNNTIITAWIPTITSKSKVEGEKVKISKTLKTISSGRIGLKNARRGSPYASELVGREIGRWLSNYVNDASVKGIKYVLNVYRIGKMVALGSGLRGLRASTSSANVQISSIKDITPKPHNGCRARKPRRI